MRWIWNSPDFWERSNKQDKIVFKIVFPLSIISFILLFVFLDKPKVYEILLVAFIFSAWVYTILDLIFQFPHWKIPEDYSNEAKTMMYFTQFVIASFIFYLYCVGILQHYYPFFENLVCCDLVRNFELTLRK